MTFFRRTLLYALISAPLLPAADQLTGFPFQSETLRYRVIWPGGKALGEVTMGAHQTTGGGWDFDKALRSASRDRQGGTVPSRSSGFRCARATAR